MRLQADFGVELAVLQLLKDMTIGGLADVVLRDAVSVAVAAAGSRIDAAVSRCEPPAPNRAATGDRSDRPTPDAPPTSAEPRPSAAVVRYSALDYRRWTRGQRAIQRAVTAVSRPLLDVDVQGAEHLHTPGPFVLATNHLTLLDVPLVLAVMPRPAVIFAAPGTASLPVDRTGCSADLGNAIYVDRGSR